MDNSGLDTARTNAQNAQQGVSDMTTSAPGLLNTLKQNLVGIFSDNNPIIGARNNALSDYLAEGANSRAAMLPSNVGDVPGYAGRPLTLSPTEQDAITTSKNAAAYAPLNGYNAILQAMYGQIPDMVKNAGDIYGANIQGAQGNANMLEKLYQDSISQYDAEHKSSNSGGLLDDPTIQAILAAMMGGNNSKLNQPSLDDIFGVPQPPKPVAKAAPKQNSQPSQGFSQNSAQMKFNPPAMTGKAGPKIAPLGVHIGNTFLPFTL